MSASDSWTRLKQYEDETMDEVLNRCETHPFSGGGCKGAVIRKILSIRNLLTRSNSGKRILIFPGGLDQFTEALAHNNMVIKAGLGLGIHDCFRARNIKLLDISRIAELLNIAIVNQDDYILVYLQRKICLFLNKYKIDLMIVVDIGNDYYRLFSYCCKRCKIPVCYIEHGLIETFITDPKGMKKHQASREYIDYRWTWSQKNREVLIRNGIMNSSDIYVIGYPYNVNANNIHLNKEECLFVGGSRLLETPSEFGYNKYYDLINLIYELCNSLGFVLVYRPHKKEPKRFLEKLNAKIVIDRLPANASLKKRYIVMGIRTSMLVEAGIYGCITGQLIGFENLSSSNLFDNTFKIFTDRESIRGFLAGIRAGEIFPKPVYENQLRYQQSLDTRIEEGLRWIESMGKPNQTTMFRA